MCVVFVSMCVRSFDSANTRCLYVCKYVCSCECNIHTNTRTNTHTHGQQSLTQPSITLGKQPANLTILQKPCCCMLCVAVCLVWCGVVWCGAGGVVRCGAVWCSVERANLTISQKLSTKPLTNVPCSLEKFIRVSVHTCDKAVEF